MKIYEVVAPVDEFAFTRTGRAKKAAKKDVKGEVARIERAILARMAGAGVKQLPIKNFRTMMNKVGYGQYVDQALSSVSNADMARTQRNDKIKGAVKGLAGKAMGAMKKIGANAKADAGLESMDEAATSSMNLNPKQLRKVLTKVVQLAFGEGSGKMARGKFA